MKMIALKVDMLQDRKIDCLRARPCIFQPGNFTVWDSEGVKRDPKHKTLKRALFIMTKHNLRMLG